jgi:hypothetical protein
VGLWRVCVWGCSVLPDRREGWAAVCGFVEGVCLVGVAALPDRREGWAAGCGFVVWAVCLVVLPLCLTVGRAGRL